MFRALNIGEFNSLDSDSTRQTAASAGLNQIKILLSASERYREMEPSFDPNYAVVITWKNTSPYPAATYGAKEVTTLIIILITT